MNIQESLHEILHESHGRLGDLFYGIFLEQYPEARWFFRETDLKRQSTLLMNQLQTVVAYATHHFPAAASYLELLGNQHHRRGVGKEWYPRWRDALLEALQQYHGTEWDDRLALKWRQAIDEASAAMFKGYVDAVLHV